MLFDLSGHVKHLVGSSGEEQVRHEESHPLLLSLVVMVIPGGLACETTCIEINESKHSSQQIGKKSAYFIILSSSYHHHHYYIFL